MRVKNRPIQYLCDKQDFQQKEMYDYLAYYPSEDITCKSKVYHSYLKQALQSMWARNHKWEG